MAKRKSRKNKKRKDEQLRHQPFDYDLLVGEKILGHLRDLPNNKTQKEILLYKEGLEIFKSISCAKCHIDNFTTKSGVKISPFTDMLLHDMGDELSDGHTMFRAEANEFRTPPLWGIGLYEKASGSLALLHDGRARSVEEAILWHGGEAASQKEDFKALNKQERAYLVEFIKGI